MPPPHRRLLLTSHVLCDAWAFGQPDPETDEASPTAAFPLCTAALKRVMLPNICVQCPHLSSRGIALFLHDDVRPFTMSFVFKLDFFCSWFDVNGDYNAVEPATLISLMQRISATMPYLETLRIVGMPWLGDSAAEFVSSLPSSSLRVLQFINCLEPHGGWERDHMQVLSKLLFLEELDCELTASGLDALLPLTLPAGEESFFPRLRSLTILVKSGFRSSLDLHQRVIQSPLVRQLRAVGCSLGGAFVPAISTSAGNISLEPLAHIERLSTFLMNCNLSTVPSFSLLEKCCDVGDGFLSGAHLPGAVDLSGMQNLESIGSHAFIRAHTTSIILPPTLRFIGSTFCINSSTTELDLSPCAQLLDVDTNHFLTGCVSLEKFNTSPLLGAIGGQVRGFFLARCTGLTELDLSGMRGATSLGYKFLDGCTSLRAVRGCDALQTVESVGNYFLGGTVVLEEFAFSQCVSLLRVFGDSLLSGSALEEQGKKILTEIMERNQKKLVVGGSSCLSLQEAIS